MRVVAVQRLRAHHVAHGERPARFAREEPEPAALEVLPHRGRERVMVVLERAAVLPHERQRRRLVEAQVARRRLEAVDDVAEEGREHDVVAADRVGVRVEVAEQVQRAPVLPHPQVGVLVHHLGERLGHPTRRVGQVVGGVQRHRPGDAVELVAQLGSAVELLAPVHPRQAVVGLLGERVAPAEELGIHVVGWAQGGDPFGDLRVGEVGVQLGHHRPLGAGTGARSSTPSSPPRRRHRRRRPGSPSPTWCRARPRVAARRRARQPGPRCRTRRAGSRSACSAPTTARGR